MDKLKEQRYRGYLIAGIGGIVAFISFFLPYVSVSAIFISISFSASTIGGWLWLDFLVALIAIALPLVLIYRSNAFGLTNMPIDKQIRYGIFAIIGTGAVGLLIQLIAAINVHNAISTSAVDLSAVGVGVNLSIGFWLLVLSSIAMIVGGIMAYRELPALIAGQSWQYPSSTQYPPYGQQYPTPSTQYPPYPSADQTPYPSYPAQQYPPADQQQYQPTELKQPYPPTGPQQYQPPTEYQQPPYQQQYPQQQYPPQQYPPSQ